MTLNAVGWVLVTCLFLCLYLFISVSFYRKDS